LGSESGMTRSAVPPPVTLVLDAAEAWLPARMAAVEGRLAERAEGHGAILAADARATLEAGGKRLRPMLVLLCAGPAAGQAAIRAEARPVVRMRVCDRPRGSRRRPGAARLRTRDRPRVPAPRRRPRRGRPARAHREGARHRPPRRHGHPALDPRP